jgi:poly-gamma-glutamate synthesis protein (capsule biosynthesis protein)
MDWGEDAFFDTIEILQKNGIEVVGAGKNLQEARIPVIIEKRGTKVGFLAYTAILPLGLEAGEDIPGCAPLRASHYYRQLNYQPGTPPLIVTELVPEYREAMEQDIKKLRSVVDILVVSIHAGVFGVPAMIAMYQKEAGRAAVDAGADLVLQAHAHILKGIEMYKGKAIFYGLGNFAVEHTVPDPSRPQGRDPDFLLYGRFVLRHTERVPAYEKHVHHPDALKTIIAKAYVRQRRIDKVVYLPTFINPDLEPEVLSRQDKRAHQVFDYVKRISEAESLNVNFHWDGDEVVITE